MDKSFLACSKCCFFYGTYPHSVVDMKKECLKLEYVFIFYLFRGSVLSFDILYVQIFIQPIFRGP